MNLLTIFLLLILLFACHTNNYEHAKFMEYSDVYVYEDDVVSEKIEGGRVEYIDSAKSPEAWFQHMDHYILYQDSLYVHVYNEHPSKNLMLIRNLIKKHTSDSTRISEFVKHESLLSVVIKHKYTGQNHKAAKGKLFDKEVILFVPDSNSWNYDTTYYPFDNNYPWR